MYNTKKYHIVAVKSMHIRLNLNCWYNLPDLNCADVMQLKQMPTVNVTQWDGVQQYATILHFKSVWVQTLSTSS